MRILTLILGLALASLAGAEDHAAFVRQAFAAVDSEFRKDWAFTETSIEDDMTFTWRYDPRRRADERWLLIKIDGRQPTPAEIDEFGSRSDAVHDDDDEDLADELEIVNFESLELIERTDSRRVFSFKPNGDNDADEQERRFMEQVSGRLSIALDGPYVEYLELRNDKPIRPATGVKIKRFLTRLVFARLGESGPVVPMSVDVEIKGSALLVIRFDEKESIRFSDFRYVGA